jgi:copper chaperone CopZ
MRCVAWQAYLPISTSWMAECASSSPQVKSTPQRALAVEQLVRRLDGVTSVTANPITGNVLVLFTSAILGQHDILTVLQQTGYLREDHAAEQSQPNLLSLLMHSALEKALERLVLALI